MHVHVYVLRHVHACELGEIAIFHGTVSRCRFTVEVTFAATAKATVKGYDSNYV